MEEISKAKAKPDFKVEIAPISALRPHPRNYREHPDDQIQHIIKSIQQHGLYRNIVIATDGTILAGHGVVKAAREMGMHQVPVIRLNISPDDPRALKVLAGDNEINRLAEINDRELSQILKDIKELDVDGLLGTGFDEMMLANLVMVTRPASEIRDFDEAAEWVGMPEYEPAKKPLQIHISFDNEADRRNFMKVINATIINKSINDIWCIWYPERGREDVRSIKFE